MRANRDLVVREKGSHRKMFDDTKQINMAHSPLKESCLVAAVPTKL